jgi:hypothetical protein
MTGDFIDNSLRSLPLRDAEPRVTDRIRRRALATLREERERVAHPWRGRIAHIWDRVEPMFSSAVVGAYLAWMVWTLIALVK